MLYLCLRGYNNIEYEPPCVFYASVYPFNRPCVSYIFRDSHVSSRISTLYALKLAVLKYDDDPQ